MNPNLLKFLRSLMTMQEGLIPARRATAVAPQIEGGLESALPWLRRLMMTNPSVATDIKATRGGTRAVKSSLEQAERHPESEIPAILENLLRTMYEGPKGTVGP